MSEETKSKIITAFEEWAQAVEDNNSNVYSTFCDICSAVLPAGTPAHTEALLGDIAMALLDEATKK